MGYQWFSLSQLPCWPTDKPALVIFTFFLPQYCSGAAGEERKHPGGVSWIMEIYIKKKRLMLENSCSRCSSTAQPSRLGSPTFQNQIPVLLLCWKTSGCSRDLAFCGWSIFPRSEASTLWFFHINKNSWNHGMGWVGKDPSVRSWDGRFWEGNKVSKVRRAHQGRLKESPGEESPQSGWLLKKTGFFYFFFHGEGIWVA